MAAPPRFEIHGAVARVQLDDGKVNALSPEVFDALNAALDRAESEARALLLIGRAGYLSAGFDLKVITQQNKAAAELLQAGVRFLARLLETPLPVVVACSGHAIALGALILLAADLRIGARGDFKLGLNEVAIRMTLPNFALHLARERLSKRHLLRSTLLAELHSPESARDAGYLDRVVAPEELEAVALEEAARLAALPRENFAGTKARLRGATARAVREDLRSN